MYKYIARLYRVVFSLLAMPVFLFEYLKKSTGREYDIGPKTKVVLALKMLRNTRAIPTASHFLEHITMATQIMKIPRSIHGCIVECGCYAGGSTANLSLACALTGRRLEVFDSFKGLPNLPEQDRTNTVLNVQEGRHRSTYSPGEYIGELEVVKTNVSRWGNIEVCEFNAGYFDEVLPSFSEACVFIFLDVDLRSSLETCVEHLWPLLQEGCYLFTHDAQEIELVSLFFDNAWWQKTLGMRFPGLAGAGSGLGLIPDKGAFTSELAFTVR